MFRRSVLARIGAGVGILGGYVAWNRYQSPSLPDGIDSKTLYVTGNVFGEPDREDGAPGPREQRQRVIGDEESATEGITFDESAVEFAEETDFDDSYLIIVQTGMQTEPDLELKGISRIADGLHLAVSVEHPWGRGVNDDLGTHSLLIRVTDERNGIPESVSVDITGYV